MEMVTIKGIRYRLADAQRLGLFLETKKRVPANKARSVVSTKTAEPEPATGSDEVEDEK